MARTKFPFFASSEVAAATVGEGAITATELNTDAVTAVKIAANAVETAKIKDSNVTAAKLAADAVETAKIKDANVTLGKLATGITPSHVAKFAGTITWSGSGASLDTTITGVAATDIVQCTFRVAPTQAAYIASAIPSTNHLIITLSTANTSNQAQIDYVIFRATS